MVQKADILPPPISLGPRRARLWVQHHFKIIILGIVVMGVVLLLSSLNPLNHAWTRKIPHTSPLPDTTAFPAAPLPPIFEFYRRPAQSTINETALREVQDAAYHLTSHKRAVCGLQPWHYERYARLGASSPSLFLAINLHNNAGVSPNFIQELPIILRFLDPRRVHVSIYESGSTDETPQFLVLLAHVFDALGTSYTIVSNSTKLPKDGGRRINVLAAARNIALAPLYDGSVAQYMPDKQFDTVLFLNDVIFCAADVLEVLHSKAEQGAHEACSVDWDWNGRVVYDRWVLRALSGRPWYEHDALIDYYRDPRSLDVKRAPSPLYDDPENRARFLSLLPIQVFSCWNGMAAFTATAFLKHDIRFREARNDLDDAGNVKTVTEKASECYLSSVDMWKAGLGKILLVTRARVAYSVDDYNIYRADHKTEELGAKAATVLGFKDHIVWSDKPPVKVAMHDWAWWENPERWAPWDEP